MADDASSRSDEIEFSWGTKRGRGGKKKEVQFYESFTFDGVEYSLYDSVYLFKDGESKPYVGKLIKIWEHPSKERKVKILWFFHPSEISNYLRGESMLENELFLATGVGKGLTNVNPLESIAGKCNVVCISKDERNRQPFAEEVNKAHHVYYRTFDVEHHTISENLGDKIAMIEVHFLLNKNNFQPLDLCKIDNGDVPVDLEKLLISIKDTIAADDAGECDVTGHDNLDLVTSSQKITSSLPKSKKKDVKENISNENATNDATKLVDSGNILKDSVLPITPAENENSKLVIGKHRPTSGKPDDRPLKKLKLGGSSPLSCESGETGTPKPAIVASNKTSQSIDKDKGQLFKEVNGVSNGLRKKIKSDGLIEDKSNDKLAVGSVNQSKDKQGSAAVRVAANETPQLANGDDKHNVRRKLAGSGNGLSKKVKSESVIEDQSDDKLRKVPVKEEPRNVKIEASLHVKEVKEVTQRPPDRSKWFTATPWEDRLKEAYDQGRLVLLHNLFPAYTSSEIEDIIWLGFEESCTAKVVQRTASSNRFFGQALAIFKSREIAEKILRKLDTGCLMLPNGRPLVGTRGVVYFPAKNSSFPGHLVIDKVRHQMQREAREAVSTSHSSQPNTIEYEMATEWRLLQDRADLWWKMLHKRQGEEIKKTKASMKSLSTS